MKLGSLFDGSGTCPSTALMLGVTPVWASEVEPYPIAVTKHQIPNMKHVGNIMDMNGADLEPVDIITFGSPCQDLSVAGNRAGIHEGERSNLFFEAIRIIKEMRQATNGEYPRFIMWENVPGAYSSNKGHDFHAVLESICSVCETGISIPKSCDKRKADKLKWSKSGEIVGNAFSLAWRTLDAQFWGVPQRRKRIFLVADFTGQCAGEVLFKPESLRRNFAKSRETRKRTTSNAERSINGSGGVECLAAGFCTEHSASARGIGYEEEVSPTLRAGVTPAMVYAIDRESFNCGQNFVRSPGISQDGITSTLSAQGPGAVCFEPRSQDGVPRLHGDISPTINTAQGGQRQPCVCVETPKLLKIRSGCDGGGKGPLIQDNKSATISCNNDQILFQPSTGSGKQQTGTLQASCADKQFLGNQEALSGDYHILEEGRPPRKYIVRRLSPKECGRLQGFPDGWSDIPIIEDMTDEDYEFWCDVLKTKADIDEKPYKEKTKKQMIAWYNKLHSDSAEYKMWGNGMALPCVLYVMEGIVDVLQK